ncbi:MAG: hypothetical protein ACFB15_13945 [Cyclobacteriaceae bacterium]
MEDIVDRRSDIYQDRYQDVKMEEADWLGVIKYNPERMRTPIGLSRNRAVICETPGDLLKLDNR